MKKKRKALKNSKNTTSLNALKKGIIALFKGTDQSLTHKDICRLLQVKDKITKHQILFVIKNLLADRTIKEIAHGKYGIKQSQSFYEGKIEKVVSGAGYVICDELDSDVFISARNAGQTLGGDLVRISLTGKHNGKNPEGIVLKVIERVRKEFVGNLRIDGGNCFVTPDNSRVGTDFYIPKDKLNGAKNGDKVLVRILDWPKRAKSPFAEVSKIIGRSGEHHAVSYTHLTLPTTVIV